MGTHPIFESDFDCLTDMLNWVRDWWCSLDRHAQDQLFQVGSTLLALAASYYTSCRMMDMIAPEKLPRKRALSILASIGLTRREALEMMNKMSPHEMTALSHVVTDFDRLEPMDGVKGLKKAKTTIDQNLRRAMRLRQCSPELAELISMAPGILLHGPPGCGKTMLARAVAKESGFRFVIVKPSLIKNKYVGESEKTIQATFSLAARLQPSILFIDEIDVLLSSRDDGSHSSFQNQIIAEFLTAWDGFDRASDGAVVVIGATNRLDALDVAIQRRLPLKVEVPLPDLSARRSIFEAQLVRKGVKVEAELDGYIRETEKWNASKISHFLKTVLLQAAIESDIDEIEKIEAPVQRESLIFKVASGFISLGNSIIRRRREEPKQKSCEDHIVLTVRDNHLQAAMEQFTPSTASVYLRNLYT